MQDDWKIFIEKTDKFQLTDRSQMILKCAQVAHQHGFSVFGIRNKTTCLGTVHAPFTYMRYGRSTNCHNGTGGPGSMDVYSLDGNYMFSSLSHENIHCSFGLKFPFYGSPWVNEGKPNL